MNDNNLVMLLKAAKDEHPDPYIEVTAASQVNDVYRRRLGSASISVSFLKHYCNFSITFTVIVRSISGTGKVDSVIISFWNIQKL